MADLAVVAAAVGRYRGRGTALCGPGPVPGQAGGVGRVPIAPGAPYRTISGCWRPNWAGPGTRSGISRRPLSLEQQIGALPYLAHSLGGLAGALTMREGAKDAARASEHRRRAREIAERLGMTVLLERLVSCRPMSGRSPGTARTGCWRRETSMPGCGTAGACIICVPCSPRPGGRSGPSTLWPAGRGWRVRDWARSWTPPRVTPTGPAGCPRCRARRRRPGWRPSAAEPRKPSGQALLAELRRAAGLGGRTAWSRLRRSGRGSTSPGRCGRRSSGWRRRPRAPPRTCGPRSAPARACRYEPAPGGPSRWHV